MLRELLGWCVPVLLHVPVIDPDTFNPSNESAYPWYLHAVKEAENRYFHWKTDWLEYGGIVIAMTDDTITLRRKNRIPRTFVLAPPLLSETLPLTGNAGMGYRFRDLRLGDVVDLDVVPVRDQYVAIAIGIFRRPGGVIPPDENPTGTPEKNRWHHYYNAVQLVEEFVVPNFHRLAYPLVPVAR